MEGQACRRFRLFPARIEVFERGNRQAALLASSLRKSRLVEAWLFEARLQQVWTFEVRQTLVRQVQLQQRQARWRFVQGQRSGRQEIRRSKEIWLCKTRRKTRRRETALPQAQGQRGG